MIQGCFPVDFQCSLFSLHVGFKQSRAMTNLLAAAYGLGLVTKQKHWSQLPKMYY